MCCCNGFIFIFSFDYSLIMLKYFFYFLSFSIISCRNFNLSLISKYTITGTSEIIPTMSPTIHLTAYSLLNKTQAIYSENYPLQLYIDPPNNYFATTALGVFIRCISSKGISTNTKVYYKIDSLEDPTKIDSFTTYQAPYVHIDTPFQVGRSRTFKAICIEKAIDGNTYRSQLIERFYTIEAASRPLRYLLFYISFLLFLYLLFFSLK